ncbi:MAG: YlxR family protein [Lachnospiraceae bacterium]|nr:YlxR family protein [Lachnospiraceae bacterium]
MERRVPVRTCIGCRTRKSKMELVRIAGRKPDMNDKDLTLVIDSDAGMDGRGVYLCKSMECFDRALKYKQFIRAFGTTVSDEQFVSLRHDFEKRMGENSEKR